MSFENVLLWLFFGFVVVTALEMLVAYFVKGE